MKILELTKKAQKKIDREGVTTYERNKTYMNDIVKATKEKVKESRINVENKLDMIEGIDFVDSVQYKIDEIQKRVDTKPTESTLICDMKSFKEFEDDSLSLLIQYEADLKYLSELIINILKVTISELYDNGIISHEKINEMVCDYKPEEEKILYLDIDKKTMKVIFGESTNHHYTLHEELPSFASYESVITAMVRLIENATK